MATKYSSLKNRYEMYLGNESNIELVRIVAFQFSILCPPFCEIV